MGTLVRPGESVEPLRRPAAAGQRHRGPPPRRRDPARLRRPRRALVRQRQHLGRLLARRRRLLQAAHAAARQPRPAGAGRDAATSTRPSSRRRSTASPRTPPTRAPTARSRCRPRSTRRASSSGPPATRSSTTTRWSRRRRPSGTTTTRSARRASTWRPGPAGYFYVTDPAKESRALACPRPATARNAGILAGNCYDIPIVLQDRVLQRRRHHQLPQRPRPGGAGRRGGLEPAHPRPEPDRPPAVGARVLRRRGRGERRGLAEDHGRAAPLPVPPARRLERPLLDARPGARQANWCGRAVLLPDRHGPGVHDRARHRAHA